MTYNIYYYETLKNSLKNFLRIKGVKMPYMIKDIALNREKYLVKSYIPKMENLNKTTISLTGEKKYFQMIEEAGENVKIGPYMGKLIYNYMYVHKDDEPVAAKGKNKRVTIYFSSEEWEKLKGKIGNKTINEYIREAVL